jgi:hypothetical protein
MNKAAQNNALIALFLIIVGATIVAFMITKDTKPTNTDLVEEHYEGTNAQNFNFLMPEAWSYTDNAVQDIQSLTPGQVLQFGIVADPTQAHTYYFATSAGNPNESDEKDLLSVYVYDSSTYEYTRIWRANHDSTQSFYGLDSRTWPILHVIGYDNGKLIILAQDMDDSPGPCSEVLTMGRDTDAAYRKMFSLNLADPYAKGLEAYRVPNDIYAEALDRQNKCVANM